MGPLYLYLNIERTVVMDLPEFKDKLITVLWYGDSPAVNTGFGIVSQNLTMGLWQTGKYRIVAVGINDRGQEHPIKKLPNYHVVPIPDLRNDPYGYQVLPQALQQYKPDIIIVLNDIWLISGDPARGNFGWFEKTL